MGVGQAQDLEQALKMTSGFGARFSSTVATSGPTSIGVTR
jgi:hypothetical protein